MKKIIKILMALILLLNLFACGNQKIEVNEEICKEFDKFLDELPSRILEPNNKLINQYFVNPANASISPELYDWNYLDLAKAHKQSELNAEIIADLHEFDFRELDATRREHYQVIESAFTTDNQDVETVYMLENKALGAFNATYLDIFVTLYFYQMRNENDALSYINLVDKLDEYASNLVEFEQLRQNRGYGMTKTEIDLSIGRLESLVDDVDFNFVLEAALAKVEDFNNQEYTNYLNENLVSQLIKFFNICIEGLEKLDIKQADETILSNLDGGKEYYASLIYKRSGFSDMNQYYEYLKQMQNNSYAEMSEIAMNIEEDIIEADYGVYYTDLDNPKDLIEKFKERLQLDFPTIPSFDYQINTIPLELSKLLDGTAGFYVFSAIDDSDATQQIMLSEDYTAEDFIVIAHEAYPGHMYQNLYANNLDLPLIRKMLRFVDYTEGYANYIEAYITNYANNPDVAKFIRLSNKAFYAQLLIWDYEINYLGENILPAMNNAVGENAAQSLYYQLQYNPAAYAHYYVAGSLIEDMYSRFENTMSIKEFHENILKHGPMPINLLKSELIEDSRK